MTFRTQQIVAWSATFVFVAAIALYVLEIKTFGNTVEIEDLFWKSVLAGTAAGLGAGFYFHKKSEQKEAVAIFRRWLTCLAVPVIFAPMLGSQLNRAFSSEKALVQEVEFLEEKPFFSGPAITGEKIKPEGFYVFVFFNGKVERFESERQLFPAAQRGDLVELELRRGGFGYYFFEKKPPK